MMPLQGFGRLFKKLLAVRLGSHQIMQTPTYDPIKHSLMKLNIKFRAPQPNPVCAMIIMLRQAMLKPFHAKFSSRETAPIRLNIRETEYV
jgi:hypothetical protein